MICVISTEALTSCAPSHPSGLLGGLGSACAGLCGLAAAREGCQGGKGAVAPAVRQVLPSPSPSAAAPLVPRTTPALSRSKSQTRISLSKPMDSLEPDVQDSRLLAFFRGPGVDACGRTLQELKAMDFHSMEKVHNYIQWMFPTDEASQFNGDAPTLTPELQQCFAEDPALRQQLRSNLARFCEFLGLELQASEEDEPCVVVVAEAPHFFDRWQDCWRDRFRGRNHNWLRVSRVLVCLGRCSLVKEQGAFLKCLEQLYAGGVPCGLAISYWRERAQTRPVPIASGH